jgi:hypothetical protein
MMVHSILTKKVKYKRNIKRLFQLIALFIGVILYRSLALLIIYFILLLFFYSISKYGSKEDQKRKDKQPLWKDEEFILPLNQKFSIQGFQIVFPLMMAYILLSSILIEEMYAEYSSMSFLIMMVMYVFLSVALLINVLQDFKNIHLLYKDGFQIMGFNHPYESIVMHQFIKLRKGGYIFEARTAKIVISIKVCDKKKEVIESLLAK